MRTRVPCGSYPKRTLSRREAICHVHLVTQNKKGAKSVPVLHQFGFPIRARSKYANRMPSEKSVLAVQLLLCQSFNATRKQLLGERQREEAQRIFRCKRFQFLNSNLSVTHECEPGTADCSRRYGLP